MSDVKKTYDIVIVGNGIMGLSLAYELRKRDNRLKIAVVGPDDRKNAATTAAGAMINVFAELSDGQFDDPALKARSELSLNAFDLWDDLCAALSEHAAAPVAIKWGSYIYKTPGGSQQEERTMRFIADVLADRGLPSRELSRHTLAWFNPKCRMVDPSLLEVPDGRVDPLAVLRAYEATLKALSVDLYDDKVAALVVGEGGTGHSVALEKQGLRLAAAQVVLANGSFAQRLVDQNPTLRSEVPALLWGGGSAVIAHFPDWVRRWGGVDPNIFKLDKVVRSLVRDNACGLHVVPQDDGSYYVGASAAVLAEYEEYPRLHAVESLMVRVVEEISKAFFYAGVQLRGPGYRPVSADCFPLLGQSHIPGIWFSNGMKRDGFTCSPYISGQLASQMLGGASTLPTLFEPSRKLISYRTKKAAIEETATANYHGELLHGLDLPAYAEESYMSAQRTNVERVYAKRGIEGFGIHPEVVHLYDNDDYFKIIDHPRAAPLGA